MPDLTLTAPSLRLVVTAGRSSVIEFQWPEGQLDGRTFEAVIEADGFDDIVPDLTVDGDTMQVALTSGETSALFGRGSALFKLLDTTTDPAEPVILGTARATDTATTPTTSKVTVVDQVAHVTVRVIGGNRLINFTPLELHTASLPDAGVGVAYTKTLSASGGATPYDWAATGLPAGLTVNHTTGVISGTPTVAGTFSVTVTVTDAAGTEAADVFVLQVVAVLITTRTPTAAQVGVDYSFQLLASGGDGDYTFTPGTGMPPGLTMSQAGLVVGTPTTVGTSTVQVTVADGSSHTATSPVVFEVDAAPVVVPAIVIDSDTSLPGALVGQDYSVPLEAHGGSGTLAWSVSAGALPDGLFLSPGGVVVGNPTTGGDFTFTAFVSDSETPPKTQVKVFTVHVDAPVTGERYDFATTPTTTEMIVDGTGVTVTGGEARVFGGTNYTTQRLRDYRNFRATVKVTPNLSLTTVFRLVPSPTTTDDTVLSFALVQAPSSNLLARSFQASAEDEVDLGLSAGSGVQWWRIQFNEGTGEMEFLRATAAEAGPYTLLHSLELDDPADAEALCARLRSGGTTSSYTPFDDLDISPLNGATGTTTPTITTTGLADAVQGSPYSKTLAVVGGSGVKVWSVTAGTLPAGLSLNASTGVISGTPTGTGTSSFTVQASVGGVNATKALTITVGSSGAVVPYTGPKLGTVATLSLILDNELPFWSTPKNALAKMVELGFDGFAFGGVGEVLGVGSRWDDHAWPASRSAGQSYNDLGQPISNGTGIQISGFSKFGKRAWCQFYMPGGYANDDPIQWTNEGYLAPWLNRVANTVKFLTSSTMFASPWDGIYLDDEADQSFDLDFVMAHQGLTEAQARQAVFNVGKRFAQAIVNNWNTARVGHEPWIMAYAMDVMVGSWVAQTQIDVNDADPDWADRLMYREFLAGMGQVDGFIWHDISALYYRHPQGNWHDGVHSGALDGSDAAVRYAAGRQVSNFRTGIANYSDPSDPFNAFRVFAHPENFGSCGYAWWDGNQSPESFPHPNQSAAAAGVEATAMADFMEGVTAVFFYSTFDPDLDLRTYTTAIQAYDAG